MYTIYLNLRLEEVFLRSHMLGFGDLLMAIRDALNLTRVMVREGCGVDPACLFRVEMEQTKSHKIVIPLTIDLLEFYGIQGRKAKIVIDKLVEYTGRKDWQNAISNFRKSDSKSKAPIFDEQWSAESIRLPSSEKAFGEKDASIPNTKTEIEQFTFFGNRRLEEVSNFKN